MKGSPRFHFALPFLWGEPGASFPEPPFCLTLVAVSLAARRGRRASARPAFSCSHPLFFLCSSDTPLQKTEVRRQKSGDRSRKTEDRRRKSEVGRQESEVRRQEAEVGRQKPEAGSQKLEGRSRKLEFGRREAEVQRCKSRNSDGGRVFGVWRNTAGGFDKPGRVCTALGMRSVLACPAHLTGFSNGQFVQESICPKVKESIRQFVQRSIRQFVNLSKGQRVTLSKGQFVGLSACPMVGLSSCVIVNRNV